jgi:hypothetical protein
MAAWLHGWSAGLLLVVMAAEVILLAIPWGGTDVLARGRAVGRLTRVLHPLQLTFMGLAIVTGGHRATELKPILGMGYLGEFFRLLLWKLGVVFIGILAATYQYFGLGVRLDRMVRAEPSPDEVARATIPGRIRRLRVASIVTLACFATTFLLGRAMRG